MVVPILTIFELLILPRQNVLVMFVSNQYLLLGLRPLQVKPQFLVTSKFEKGCKRADYEDIKTITSTKFCNFHYSSAKNFVGSLLIQLPYQTLQLASQLILPPCSLVHSMHCFYFFLSFAQYHLMLTFNLGLTDHTMHFQQQLLINAHIKQYLSTQLASYRVYVQLYFILQLQLAIVHCKSCVLGHR